MNKKTLRIASVLMSVVIVLAIVFTIGPVKITAVEGAAPPPVTRTYDLFATDGYWTLADGTQIYSYGFIGGLDGSTISYLDTRTGDNSLETANIAAPTPGSTLSALEQDLQGNAQFPAPLIYAAAGDTIIIRLKNLGTSILPTAPNDPHSIHLHGLDVNVANDGVPETSVATVPANLEIEDPQNPGSFIPAPGAGNVVYYVFTPAIAGTYFYHCHQEADIHVTMGMYGALIVYNPGEAGANTGPGSSGSLYGWKYDKDYVALLSDTDVRQHLSETGVTDPSVTTPNGNIVIDAAAQQGDGAFNPVAYKPQYWFINDLSFPTTLHLDTPGLVYGDWEAAHPGYDPLIAGKVGGTGIDGKPGQRVLVRMINMGYETQPMHSHGFHPKVLGSDQRAWFWGNSAGTPSMTLPVNKNKGNKSLPFNVTIPGTAQFPTGVGLESNTVLIGSGQEYDLLFDFSTVAVTSTYDPGTQSRYDEADNSPQSNTLTQFPAIPDAGDPANPPYIGGPTVSGAVGIPGGSQIFVYHNHDDYKATNNGIYPGGMFTILLPIP